MNIPASLGAVGYAAFALVQPIPLSEIVPFPMVVTAFEAEAERLAAPPVPAPAPALVVDDLPPETSVPVETPEPVVSYAVGGYRPSAPVMPPWSQGHHSVSETSAEAVSPFDVSDPADDTGEREVAELAERTASESEPVPDAVITIPVGGAFPASGYATDGASGESRARQVLNELSFLFDDA